MGDEDKKEERAAGVAASILQRQVKALQAQVRSLEADRERERKQIRSADIGALAASHGLELSDDERATLLALPDKAYATVKRAVSSATPSIEADSDLDAWSLRDSKGSTEAGVSEAALAYRGDPRAFEFAVAEERAWNLLPGERRESMPLETYLRARAAGRGFRLPKTTKEA